MVKIKVICVGKIKDSYLTQGIGEYLKRLSGYSSIEVIEVKDEKINNDENKVKDVESRRILEKINDKDFVVLLDVLGREVSSEQFADNFKKWIDNGIGNYCFVIGGSLGVNEIVKNRANFKISFSRLTFTHQMIRLMLLEQIYRCFKINNNETYHK